MGDRAWEKQRGYRLSCSSASAQSCGKFWDKDGLMELSHLEAKGLGFYTAVSWLQAMPRGSRTTSRHFWVKQLLWVKNKSSVKGVAASQWSPTFTAAK